MKKKALLISCFNFYKGRLEPVRECLKQEYDVTVLLSDFDHINKSPVSDKFEDCLYLHALPYKKNISMQRIFSHMFWGRRVKKHIKELQPDLIYLLVPPNNIACYCLKYKKRNPQIKYYVDIIDMWPESMPIGRLKDFVVGKIWKRWRKDSIELADHVFTECDFYREKLKKEIGNPNRASTVYLYKEQSEEERLMVTHLVEKKKARQSKKTLSFAYLGSINHIIDIEGICKILKTLIEQGYDITVKVIGAGEKQELFCDELKATGAAVFFYGKIYDPIKKIEILGECDYGFNMMKSSVAVGLTIKSIDYFSMGLPIINNILGDTWNLVEKEHIGINYDGNLEQLVENIKLKDWSDSCVIKCFGKYFTKESFVERISKVL